MWSDFLTRCEYTFLAGNAVALILFSSLRIVLNSIPLHTVVLSIAFQWIVTTSPRFFLSLSDAVLFFHSDAVWFPFSMPFPMPFFINAVLQYVISDTMQFFSFYCKIGPLVSLRCPLVSRYRCESSALLLLATYEKKTQPRRSETEIRCGLQRS